MNIGFIGTGRIAARLVGALAGEGHSLLVSRRNAEMSSALDERHVEVAVHDGNQAIVDASDIVFLCLPPGNALDRIRELRFTAEQDVISVMAGVVLDDLQAAVAPARRVAITIPMPAIEHGGCPLPVHPASPALETLFGERNHVIPVPSEEQLTPFWAASGSMLALLAELRTVASWLGERIDDPVTGERYIAALYASALDALPKDGAGRLDQAIADLSIEGGLNATFHERIAAGDHHAEVRAGLDALHRRLTGATD